TRRKLELAQEDLGEAFKIAPDDVEVLLAAAELERIRGRADDARAHLRRGQSLHPEDPRWYRYQAAVELADGKSADALASLRQGIKAAPTRLQGALRWTLANLLVDKTQIDDARAELTRLEKGGYSPPAVDYLSARLLASDGQWAPAARRFEQARAAV